MMLPTTALTSQILRMSVIMTLSLTEALTPTNLLMTKKRRILKRLPRRTPKKVMPKKVMLKTVSKKLLRL